MEKRPGPNARVVGRGRVSAVLIWSLILVVGISGILLGGIWAKLIIGVPFTLLAFFGFGTLLQSRVWVDGSTLYSRTLVGYGQPIRLDDLQSARLETNSSWGRELHFTTRDGKRLRLDATNLRLVRLYEALAEFIGPYDRVANELLQRRMERYRGSGLPG